MRISPSFGNGLKGLLAGFLAGGLFIFLLGGFDPSRYVIEQLTLVPFEAFWIAVAAYVTLRWGFPGGFFYLAAGSIGAAAMMTYPVFDFTGVVFFKTAIAGVILAESRRFWNGFSPKFFAASIPGVVFAGVAGLPYAYRGVPDSVLARVKEDALNTYLLFMSPDDARTAAENAMSLLGGIFGVSFAILALGTVVSVWIAFFLLRWLRREQRVQSLPGIAAFSLPFPVMWVFLASFGLVLSEVKPVYPAALNILLVTAGLYGVQGMAVIAYFMRTSFPGRFSRVLFWMVFFITLAFSSVIVVFIGVIDNWFHLRPAPTVPGAMGGDEGRDNEGNSER